MLEPGGLGGQAGGEQVLPGAGRAAVVAARVCACAAIELLHAVQARYWRPASEKVFYL